jgi:hypothetical protein
MSTPLSSPRTRSPRRVAMLALSLLAMVLWAGGCATGGAAATASLESPPRPSGELAPGEPDPGDDLEDLLPDMPELSIPDMTVPEIDVPGLGEEFDRCMDLFMAYSDLVVLAFSGDPDGRLPALFDELEAAVPEDLQDELAIVRSAVEEAAAGGVLDAAGALIGEEFVAANEAIINWLSTECQVGGEGA